MRDDLSELDRLVEAMNVRLSAFALLNLSPGHRLIFNGSAAPIVHFVLTGKGFFEFAAGPPVAIEAGTIVVLPPGCRKSIRIDKGPAIDVSSGDRCEMDLGGLVRVDAGERPPVLTILCGSLTSGVLGGYSLFEKPANPLFTDLRHMPFGEAAFELLRDEMATPAFATPALASAIMKACLALLVRQHLDALLVPYTFARGIADEHLRRAVFRVLERPGTAHTVAALAEVAGMSRTSFARGFKAQFATSPMAFVMRTRLRHAAELLATTDLPVKMIAASTGLSRSHFSRAFRAAYGRDPVAFRCDSAPPLKSKSGEG